MDRFYYICEKLHSGKSKFLTVLCGKKIALAHLKQYAAETTNEVYVLDVLTEKVISSVKGH
jgi:hypothetical protein